MNRDTSDILVLIRSRLEMDEGKQARMSDEEYQARYGHPRPRRDPRAPWMGFGTEKKKAKFYPKGRPVLRWKKLAAARKRSRK